MFKRLLLVLLALTTLMIAVPSARAQEDGRTPLMVVRFTKGDVYYAQQLYNAVSKAVQIKPEVMFDVVALAPQGVSAEKVAGHMVKNLNSIGVPTGRINVQARGNQAVTYPEVRLYVR